MGGEGEEGKERLESKGRSHFLVAQLVKNLPAMQKTPVRS